MAEAVSGSSRKRDASRSVLRYGVTPPEPPPAEDDGLDLQQLGASIYERWRFVVAVATLVFGATLAHTCNSGMTFKSSGRLYLGDLELFAKGNSQSAGNVDISGAAQGDVGSEIEILKSQTLVSRAILDSGFNVAVAPPDWRPPRFWQWLAAKRNPNVLDVPTRELRAVNTMLADNSRGAQSYVVQFVNQLEYELRSQDGRPLGNGRLGAPLQVPGLSLTLREGLDTLPRVGVPYELTVRPLDASTDEVISALVVTPAKGIGAEAAKVVSLEFTDRSAYYAATVLLSIMNGYLDERQAWKAEDASAAESFVTQQLRSLRESLEKSERKLADYRSNTRPVVLNNEASAMIAQVAKYEEQRVAARLQVAALSDVKRALKLPNPPTEAFLVGEATDTVLTEMASSLTRARQLLSDYGHQYGRSAPQTTQAESQIEVQLEMIRNHVTSRLARAQESLTALNAIIAQFEERLKTVPGAELGLVQLGRESEVYSRVYSYMLERQQQAAIIKASTVSKNRILDMPQVPYREDAPKLMVRMASAPVGLLLGIILVLLHRAFASSLQSQSEVRKVLGAHPIYAVVPRREMAAPNLPDVDSRSTLDVMVGAPNSPYVEAFRALRTGLYTVVEDPQCIVALITSPRPDDGKTTCVMSLAEILAADKRRVLVIDADLRKPSHHELTNQHASPGLRGVLSGQVPWRDAVRSVRFTFGSFDSIAAGKAAPAELLSSERMSRLLAEIREHYDFVLLDSPSFPLLSDALVLATVSDCVLSVFRMRNSPRKQSAEHVRRLADVSMNYGAIVIDSNLTGTEYPLRKREPAFVRAFHVLSEILERPIGRFLGGHFSMLKFWTLLCVAALAVALVMIAVPSLMHKAKTAATNVLPPAPKHQAPLPMEQAQPVERAAPLEPAPQEALPPPVLPAPAQPTLLDHSVAPSALQAPMPAPAVASKRPAPLPAVKQRPIPARPPVGGLMDQLAKPAETNPNLPVNPY